LAKGGKKVESAELAWVGGKIRKGRSKNGGNLSKEGKIRSKTSTQWGLRRVIKGLGKTGGSVDAAE